jgi:hypothetical protein
MNRLFITFYKYIDKYIKIFIFFQIFEHFHK